MKKSALIVDVIKSRSSKDRYFDQVKIKNTITYLNKVFDKGLVKSLEISSGDSIQGLFENSGEAFLCVRMLQMMLYPIKIRAGIGRGKLDYDVAEWTSNELDGEAYHYAKQAITIASNSDNTKIIYYSKQDDDRIINLLLDTFTLFTQTKSLASRQVLFVNEIKNPLSLSNNIEFNNYKQNSECLGFESLKLKDKLISDESFVIEPYDKLKEASFLDSKDYIKRGVQKQVAEILGVSAQNVNKIYRDVVKYERKYAVEISRLLYQKEVYNDKCL